MNVKDKSVLLPNVIRNSLKLVNIQKYKVNLNAGVISYLLFEWINVLIEREIVLRFLTALKAVEIHLC